MKRMIFLSFCIGAFLLPVFVWAAPNAYIPNRGNNNVFIIDLATDSIIKTVDVGSQPLNASVSPNGEKVLVANYGENTVSVINTASNTVIDSIASINHPYGIAFSPDSRKAYVANYGASNVVSVINLETNTKETDIAVGSSPISVVVNPNGQKAYVANYGGKSISVINLVTNTVTKTIDVNTAALGIATSPFVLDINMAGTKVYVGNINIEQINNFVTIVDLATESVEANIYTQTSPFSVAVNNLGTKLYATNSYFDTISIIDLAINSAFAIFQTGNYPIGLDFNPSNSKLYSINTNSGTLSVFDTATNQLLNTITLGSMPSAMNNFIAPAAVALPDSSSISFGKQRIGKKTSVHNLTITNNGNLNLDISSVSLASGQKKNFKIKTNTCIASIAPLDSCNLGLIFKPLKKSGSKTAVLAIVSNDLENPITNITLSGQAIYAKKFVTKKAKTKQILIKKKKTNYYASGFNFALDNYPKKLKKKKYYLKIDKELAYPLNYKDARQKVLKKYYRLTTNMGNYRAKNLSKLYSVKAIFKYSQKEFKNLKKRNSKAKEKNLFLKFRTMDSDWQPLIDYWKGIQVRLNTKKNTITVRYFSKFEENKYFFALGLK